MKPTFIFPLATALLGFALGWAVKPASKEFRAQPAGSATATPESKAGNRPLSADHDQRPLRSGTSPDKIHPLPEYNPASMDDAKMLRLAEVLGLNQQQTAQLKEGIATALTSQATTENILQDMITRGNALEVAISRILTPEQLDKFEELRQRERDNRTETKAQETLNASLQGIDLSPDQRKEALSRLRQYSKEQIQSIPASAALLLESSILPIGEQPISPEALLMMADSQETPAAEQTDPAMIHEQATERRRKATGRLLQCFEGILTPAQMSQYQLSLAKQEQIFESVPASSAR